MYIAIILCYNFVTGACHQGGIFLKRTLIGLAIAAVAILIVVFMNQGESTETMQMDQVDEDKLPGLKVGVKAPDFELVNLNGEKVKLSDFHGEKVMLNFWATWCPPCKEEIPDMEKFYAAHGDEINILAVNLDPENDVEGFLKKMNATFPVVIDEGRQAMSKYDVLTIPTTFFIDEEGIIRKKHLGAMTFEMMKESTDSL